MKTMTGKSSAPKQREKDIQKAILEFLELKRIMAYRQNSGAFVDQANHFYRFATTNGLPDIVAVIGGRYVGIEVKAPGGKLRESQKAFKESLETAGGVYWCFDSLDIAVATIEDYLKSAKMRSAPLTSHGIC